MSQHRPTVYCQTCDRWFKPLGIMRHRAMHREREEDCTIQYVDGRTHTHLFSIPAKHRREAEIARKRNAK